jgi:hypothetical protein
MNWLNIQVSSLRSEEYIGSDPTARATWLNVLAWCCEQENGGVIHGASSWGDRRWQQTCGVTLAEINAAGCLLCWSDGDLAVWNYPTDKEAEVKAKRDAGSIGGRAKTEAKAQAARVNGAKQTPKQNPSTTQADTEANTQAEPKLTPNGREGKGKEGEEKGMEVGVQGICGASLATPADAPALFADEVTQSKPKKKRKLETDAEWLASLATSEAYKGINIAVEHDKCLRWFSVKGINEVSRQRFLNWLNKCDRPLGLAGSAPKQGLFR